LCGYIPYYLNYYLALKRKRRYLKLIAELFRSRDLTESYVVAYLKKKVHESTCRLYSLVMNHPETFTESPQNCDRNVPSINKRRVDDLASVLENHTVATSLPALLRYEDKNSMWHSIEARVPFLDLFFFEYVASLPLDRKLRNGWTKYIFRVAMKGILPEKIRLRRTKIGFETPEQHWIERDLRWKFREFFANTSLSIDKYCDITALRALLNAPSLTKDQIGLIWRAFNLELWYREFFGKSNTRT